MTIGIDASRSAKQFRTGTETYSTELIKNLSQIDHNNEYILYSPSSLEDKLPQLGTNFKSRILPFGKLWSQLRLSWEFLTKKKPDVFFVPAHTLPLVFPKNSVVTIHDLGFKYYPELYSPTDLGYHNWAMAHSIKRAKHLIAISEFTKQDIIKFFKTDAKKITVIYEGYNKDEFFPAKAKLENKPYILFIGRLEEKKNIIKMLEAYLILRQDSKINHQFILAGKPGFGFEKIQKTLEAIPDSIRKDIIMPGFVTQDKYIKMLKNAEIMFFCSNFEGFGLPPLEAFACGVPVVASNTTSIPEVCGQAALLVDPKKPAEMAAGLSKIINNDAFRDELIKRGLERAKQFSWEKCAQETLNVLLNVGRRDKI